MSNKEFITSDTHFGHANVIKYSGRPFASVEEMNEELIRRWNEKVPPGSIVYHLGDVSFFKNPADAVAILRRLNGTKRLVKGNHDDKIHRSVADQFEWVRDYYEARGPSKTRVLMSHFPFLTWKGAHRGSWHLHGHCHGSLRPPHPVDKMRRMDIGVDTHPKYEPYSWDEISRYMAKKPGANIDHHAERTT